jgi:Zn-dependent M28 family amino/carboxypeptidase
MPAAGDERRLMIEAGRQSRIASQAFPASRMLFWLTLVAAVAGLFWYMVGVPGRSYGAALKPLTTEEALIAGNLRQHVAAVASSEHNIYNYPQLAAAAQYIESTLAALGFEVASQRFKADTVEVRNVEAAITGVARANEIVIVGAHYDSVVGAVGANDNGSGVAAMLELARLFKDARPTRTIRFVAFVNEEPPFYRTGEMGSQYYARRSRERGEHVVAMFSLETIGWYSDEPGSQRYPFPLSFFYPSTGNFLAFVSNLSSRSLLHQAIASFRRHAQFPSEGVAAPAFIPGVDWSDHRSFWEQGYPALMVTDTAPYRYPHYHTMRDTPDKVDYERLARVVTGLHGMLRDITNN